VRLPAFCGVCALPVALSVLGLAQESPMGPESHSAESVMITVRVIDARNGNPYKNLHLRVEFLRARQTVSRFQD